MGKRWMWRIFVLVQCLAMALIACLEMALYFHIKVKEDKVVCSTSSKLYSRMKKKKVLKEVLEMVDPDHHHQVVREQLERVQLERVQLEQVNVFSAFSMPCTSKAAWAL